MDELPLSWDRLRERAGLEVIARLPDGQEVWGHRHFWQRALTRRQVVKGALGAAGLMAASAAWAPALASDDTPLPIRGGIQPFGPGTPVFHLFLPGPAAEPSTIRNIMGLVGVAAVAGTGTGTNTATGATTRYAFDTDVRFIKGTYIPADGKRHTGTFAFI